MWETCAVDLKVELPRTVAAELADVQQQDPELLNRMLMYAVARRRIFERMTANAAVVPVEVVPTSA
ncbi:MAG TPA: hypothetical protein VK939_12365 [Longimicrobiales bacterium]|nr:hypothetical protein [Longimicrobiales bacterium]